MWGILISACLVLTQIIMASCDGLFYVGLLEYPMPGSDVCVDNTESRDICTDLNNLTFEVQVLGLNGSNDSVKHRLSPTPRSKSAHITNHPLTFNFVRWPGSVNVSIHVYNRTSANDTDTGVVVDEFESSFVRYKPGNFYIQRDLNSTNSDSISVLRIIFRYYCGKTKGPSCFTDCVDHDEGEMCPLTSSTPISPEVTFTGFKCGGIDDQDINCTAHQTPKPTKNTTQIKYHDSGPTPSPKQVNSTSDTVPGMTSGMTPSSSKSNNSSTSTTKTLTSASRSAIKSTTMTATKFATIKSDDPSQTTVPTPKTTPDERSKKNDDDTPMKYWPAIVGGVLGGVAVIAAVGFCLYYRRQKKMRKRQEIYNVNPKVLRNFEEYAENGTSGRADVPLETEQY